MDWHVVQPLYAGGLVVRIGLAGADIDPARDSLVDNGGLFGEEWKRQAQPTDLPWNRRRAHAILLPRSRHRIGKPCTC